MMFRARDHTARHNSPPSSPRLQAGAQQQGQQQRPHVVGAQLALDPVTGHQLATLHNPGIIHQYVHLTLLSL